MKRMCFGTAQACTPKFRLQFTHMLGDGSGENSLVSSLSSLILCGYSGHDRSAVNNYTPVHLQNRHLHSHETRTEHRCLNENGTM